MEQPLGQQNLLLNSVNILLESINELPIENEEDFEHILEARIARDKIQEVKRAVLSEGWDFNTDENWNLSPQVTGEIPVPFNVLDVTADSSDIIVRDWRLYSKSKQTHIFDSAISCKVIWDMDFNGISHPLRHYITLRAARVFQARWIGDKNMVVLTAEDEEIARIGARRSESRTGQYNILTSQYGQDNRVRT